MLDASTTFMFIGFFFAAYSVVANDSVQTLGTFIASNSSRFKWYYLWIAASLVLVFTLGFGWYTNAGDISYDRLDKIPRPESFEWYHAAAPMVLVFLTRFGIPVSTTFLVLSVFASSVVLEKMLIKSFLGYGIAAVSAYVIWKVLSYLINEHLPVKRGHARYWRIGQWLTTGFLWFTWLSHDMANIAVFLPRDMDWRWLVFACVVLVAGLGYIFKVKGGQIQKIVLNKSHTRYVRSATIIDLIYAIILLIFKEMNSIPMSTTWVFVGLLSGRELALASQHKPQHTKNVFPIIGKDFIKMMFGLGISVGLVVAVHYLAA